jgi:mono/diheme cytochrome c family protein
MNTPPRQPVRTAFTRSSLSALAGVCVAFVTNAVGAADPPQYIAWSRTTVTAAPGAPAGYVQFQNSCAICHGPGPEKPGSLALAAKYHGSLPALLAERTDLTPEFIKYTVRHGVTVMPPFRKTELSDADLDAIAAYLTRKKR